MLLSSEQLLWACTHHLDARGAVLDVVPRWECRNCFRFRAACLHSSLHLHVAAWAWEIIFSPCASAWLNCPSCRNLGSAAPPSRSAVSAGACRCYHNTNNNQSLTDTSEALTETKHNKKASPGAESTRLCK